MLADCGRMEHHGDYKKTMRLPRIVFLSDNSQPARADLAEAVHRAQKLVVALHSAVGQQGEKQGEYQQHHSA